MTGQLKWERRVGMWTTDVPNLGRYQIQWSPSWGRYRVMLNGKWTSYNDSTTDGCKKLVERCIEAFRMRVT